MAEEEKTNIRLLKTTRERLRKYGTMGEKWDHLVNRLLDNIDRFLEKGEYLE